MMRNRTHMRMPPPPWPAVRAVRWSRACLLRHQGTAALSKRPGFGEPAGSRSSRQLPGSGVTRYPSTRRGSPVRLQDAQAMVHQWISQFEDGYWPPLANLARLTEEVGELAREINARYGPKTKKPGEAAGDLGLELADCLFVLL